jgi:hypothetical protein
MEIAIPAVLLLASLAGLVAGRREAPLLSLAALPLLLLLLGPEAGALAALATAGLALGVQLHGVVAESTLTRAG